MTGLERRALMVWFSWHRTALGLRTMKSRGQKVRAFGTVCKIVEVTI